MTTANRNISNSYKYSWKDKVILGIGESNSDYLQKLRKNLDSAAQYLEDVNVLLVFFFCIVHLFMFILLYYILCW